MSATATRGVAATLLLLALYVAAGELTQAWIGLHFDAWRARAAFGDERDRSEWLRVARVAEAATGLWPFKGSLHQDVALLHLHGLRGRFHAPADAGAAMLEAVDHAADSGRVTGELLLLEVRACLLVGDYAGAADAVQSLRARFPHGRIYWQRLLRMLKSEAQHDSDVAGLAAEVNAYYVNWLLPGRDGVDGAARARVSSPAPARSARPATGQGSD